MGGENSREEFCPPMLEPLGTTNKDQRRIGYHMVYFQRVHHCRSFLGIFNRVSLTQPSQGQSDVFAHILAAQYHRGYRMVHVTKIPGHMTVDVFGTIRRVYQGFFTKRDGTCEVCDHGRQPGVQWELRTARSWLSTKIQSLTREQIMMVSSAEVDDAIRDHTQHGERLISASVAWKTREETTAREMICRGNLTPGKEAKAVDLFFEAPSPPQLDTYQYNVTLTPVKVAYSRYGRYCYPHLDCDWMSTLTKGLDQGWRLIDIIIRLPSLEDQRAGDTSIDCIPTSLDSMWIWEKPTSRAHETAPRYEGTIVEHPVRVKELYLDRGVRGKPLWGTMIRKMGKSGWELACVVDTHTSSVDRNRTIVLKCLLFFQRPVL